MFYLQKKELTKIIKQFQEENGLNQSELSRELNWTKQLLSKIMNHRIKDLKGGDLVSLCKKINIDPYQLYSKKKEM